MKDYVAEFQERIAEIDKDVQNIYIINAGVMNHGKSSLFNSLMDSETFAEQDIRTTEIRQTEEWSEHVYLVDTPGLAAEEADDEEAYAAYCRANMILFVHTAKTGELKEVELNAINKIKGFFEDDEFFWKHFCLVLTFLDAESEESVERIREKSVADIQKFCGGGDYRIFTVSNTRYKKGRNENKTTLLKKSGIPELRKFLLDNVEGWLEENGKVRLARIKHEKDVLLTEMGQELKAIEDSIALKEKRIKDRQQIFLTKVEAAVSEWDSDEQTLESKISVLGIMRNDLSNLRDKHQRDKSNF